METWEQLLIGALVVVMLFFWWPGIKATMERSREAEKDWAGLLLPIGIVVLFVLFLIAMV